MLYEDREDVLGLERQEHRCLRSGLSISALSPSVFESGSWLRRVNQATKQEVREQGLLF